jgi:MFS family permease
MMRIAALLFLASAIGSGAATSLVLLIVWRVVGGVGVGMASVLVPAYIAEIAPAERRGRLGSLQQLAIVIGIFVALLSDFAIAEVAGGTREDLLGVEAWRWMLWAGVLPAWRALHRRRDPLVLLRLVAGARDEGARAGGDVAGKPEFGLRSSGGWARLGSNQRPLACEAGASRW